MASPQSEQERYGPRHCEAQPYEAQPYGPPPQLDGPQPYSPEQYGAGPYSPGQYNPENNAPEPYGPEQTQQYGPLQHEAEGHEPLQRHQTHLSGSPSRYAALNSIEWETPRGPSAGRQSRLSRFFGETVPSSTAATSPTEIAAAEQRRPLHGDGADLERAPTAAAALAPVTGGGGGHNRFSFNRFSWISDKFRSNPWHNERSTTTIRGGHGKVNNFFEKMKKKPAAGGVLPTRDDALRHLDRVLPPDRTYFGRPRRFLLLFIILPAAILLFFVMPLAVGLGVGLSNRNDVEPLPNGLALGTYSGVVTYYQPQFTQVGACGVSESNSEQIASVSYMIFDAAVAGSSMTGGYGYPGAPYNPNNPNNPYGNNPNNPNNQYGNPNNRYGNNQNNPNNQYGNPNNQYGHPNNQYGNPNNPNYNPNNPNYNPNNPNYNPNNPNYNPNNPNYNPNNPNTNPYNPNNPSQTGQQVAQNPLCGRKIRITRQMGYGQGSRSVDVTVVDRCANCRAENLYVSWAAFEQLTAFQGESTVYATWEFI